MTAKCWREYTDRNAVEKLLWSVALPGLGQFLNGRFVKGAVLLLLEFTINMGSHLNVAIIASFHGDMATAIQLTNYQWLMFYPCAYMFAIWDAYRDAGGAPKNLSFLPFILSAFFGTVGVIYSDVFTVAGIAFGPVWLPMIFACIGVGLGIALRNTLSMRWR